MFLFWETGTWRACRGCLKLVGLQAAAEGTPRAGMPRGIARSQEEQGGSRHGASANLAFAAGRPSDRETSAGRPGHAACNRWGGRTRKSLGFLARPALRRQPSAPDRRAQACCVGRRGALRIKPREGALPRSRRRSHLLPLRARPTRNSGHFTWHFGASANSNTLLLSVRDFDGPGPRRWMWVAGGLGAAGRAPNPPTLMSEEPHFPCSQGKLSKRARIRAVNSGGMSGRKWARAFTKCAATSSWE